MFGAFGNYMSNLVMGTEQERVQKQLEEARGDSYAVSFDLSDIRFDHLRRKRAFLKGKNIELVEEFDKEVLVGFDNLPDLLPIKPKGNLANTDFDKLMSST